MKTLKNFWNGFFQKKVDENYRKADGYACGSVSYRENDGKTLVKGIP